MPIRLPSRRGLLVLAIAGLLLLAANARADSTPKYQLIARTLFDQGRELMAAGKTQQACGKFAESMRLHPRSGTLLNLAVCHETEGKTATAWIEFKNAAALARREGRPEKAQFADERVAALLPRLSRLTLRAPAAGRAEGFEVVLDGVAVGAAALDVPIPVDPGRHKVRAQAPGRIPWEISVDVRPHADAQTIRVPDLRVESAAGPSSPLDPALPSGSARATTGFIVAGSGVVALGVGTYFGLRASAKWDDAKAECPGAACSSAAHDRSEEANAAAWGANIGLGVGVVAVALGVYLVLTDSGPRHPGTAWRLEPVGNPKAAGFGLGRAW